MQEARFGCMKLQQSLHPPRRVPWFLMTANRHCASFRVSRRLSVSFDAVIVLHTCAGRRLERSSPKSGCPKHGPRTRSRVVVWPVRSDCQAAPWLQTAILTSIWVRFGRPGRNWSPRLFALSEMRRLCFTTTMFDGTIQCLDNPLHHLEIDVQEPHEEIRRNQSLPRHSHA